MPRRLAESFCFSSTELFNTIVGALKTPFIAIASFQLVSAAFARIGETEQQIEAATVKASLRFNPTISR